MFILKHSLFVQGLLIVSMWAREGWGAQSGACLHPSLPRSVTCRMRWRGSGKKKRRVNMMINVQISHTHHFLLLHRSDPFATLFRRFCLGICRSIYFIKKFSGNAGSKPNMDVKLPNCVVLSLGSAFKNTFKVALYRSGTVV